MNMFTILTSFIYLLIECTISEKQHHHNSKQSSTTETVTLPTSCIGLDNGYHYIKLLHDDIENNMKYPIIYALCSNEYIIIDYSIDPDWSSYFTTWIKYHYGVIGPIRNDKSNWSKWFLPDRYTQYDNHIGNYIVSPDCISCDISSTIQLHNNKSSYYMSALAFGCFNPVRGWPACDFDYKTYECYICEWDNDLTQIYSTPRPVTFTFEHAIQQDIKTGICDFEIRSSIQQISQSFTKCAAQGQHNTNWKPSLGIDHRFCQCYKPFHNHKKKHITVQSNQLQLKIKQIISTQKSVNIRDKSVENKHKKYHLYAEDFKHGTYRIQHSGTYIIMEDIQFNFNAAPKGHKSPNNILDNFWWPLKSDNTMDKYPGAMGSRDAFFLGFFAGITIECDDVILDLNDYELRMSDIFYYQQPFFSIIELSSQPFLPQQGPGFFGAEPYFAKNVMIKNGIIGLSSHHGIHGNNNIQIDIINIRVRGFHTHGIQLNGFNGLNIKDTEIGPSSNKAYMNGNYGHMRLLLPKMATIANEHREDYIQFNGRMDEMITMQDLIDKVIKMMDMVLDYVVYGNTFKNHKYWNEAIDMFINPSGLPFGAVLYGLFLNYPSAGIFGWHVNDQNSFNANLENIHIHDLRHKGVEVIGLQENGRIICNSFNGPIPAKHIFGDIQIELLREKLYINDISSENMHGIYVGSIISDIHIAMYYFGRDNFDNWAGIPFYGYGDKIIDWSMGKLPEYMSTFTREEFGFYCNEDAMFHPAKGLLGLKISGVKGVIIKNIKIDNLQDETVFGSDLCGEAIVPQHGLYHFAQQLPYQVGFSMNMVMGITIDFSSVNIENIYMNNLYSKTGLVYGLAAWFESDMNINGDLYINNLNAGFGIDDNQLKYDDLPNKAAEVCAIRLLDDENYRLIVNWNEYKGLNAYQTCIYGHIGCLGDTEKYSHFRHIVNKGCDESRQPFDLRPDDFNELMELKSGFVVDKYSEEDSVGYNNFLIGMVFIAIFIMCLFIIKMMLVYAKMNNKMENQHNASELTHLIQSQQYSGY